MYNELLRRDSTLLSNNCGLRVLIRLKKNFKTPRYRVLNGSLSMCMLQLEFYDRVELEGKKTIMDLHLLFQFCIVGVQ